MFSLVTRWLERIILIVLIVVAVLNCRKEQVTANGFGQTISIQANRIGHLQNDSLQLSAKFSDCQRANAEQKTYINNLERNQATAKAAIVARANRLTKSQQIGATARNYVTSGALAESRLPDSAKVQGLDSNIVKAAFLSSEWYKLASAQLDSANISIATYAVENTDLKQKFNDCEAERRRLEAIRPKRPGLFRKLLVALFGGRL